MATETLALAQQRRKLDPPPEDIALSKGLPANCDAEKYCLGAVLMDNSKFVEIAAIISADQFTLEKHRRIFRCMTDLAAENVAIDRVTVANELLKRGQLESVDGVSYLVSLDDGLPTLSNVESYAQIVNEKHRLRQIIFNSQKAIDRALMAEESSEEIAASAAQTFVDLGTRKDRGAGSELAYQILEKHPGGINKFFESTALSNTGLRTGFTKLDEMTGGLQKQDLIVIAGRPGIGKSAICLNIAGYSALHQHKSVGIWSLEMAKRSLLNRLICAEARVDLQKLRAGYTNQDERRRMNKVMTDLSGVNLWIDDRKSRTIVEIHSAARKLKQAHGLDLVVIDYLQLLNSHVKTDNKAQALGEITRYIKTIMVDDLDVPILMLSQLNREVEKRSGEHKPILSDLKGSGSVEEDSDVVAFCYREEYYRKGREDNHGKAELLLEKNRNGPVGVIHLVFLKEYTKWENRVGDLLEGDESQ